MRLSLPLSTLAGLALAACAATAGNMDLADGVTIQDTAIGKVLANDAGMTLYVFDKDAPGVSNCYGPCAEKWPPQPAAEGQKLGKGFSIVARKDGTQQLAWHEKPLYTWFKDHKPGDTTGDGVKGVWHVARP